MFWNSVAIGILRCEELNTFLRSSLVAVVLRKDVIMSDGGHGLAVQEIRAA